MTKAKLIVLNGFAASGKTTIAKKYIAGHTLALALEADAIVDNIGDWANHEEEVRNLTFELTKAMLRAYLPSGHDVVLPYLVTNAAEVQEFEAIARDCNADYYEILLHNERADAIARLLKRGKWGEETSPPLTEKDMPQIENLMDRMESALKQRPQTIKIDLKGQDPNATYQQLLRLIGA
ncbi:MAG TPA: AAA family ATPase [Patescibacteria group bacterium]|nr:AAA family ATPase [Patescibacteria group bacterium]